MNPPLLNTHAVGRIGFYGAVACAAVHIGATIADIHLPAVNTWRIIFDTLDDYVLPVLIPTAAKLAWQGRPTDIPDAKGAGILNTPPSEA